MNIYSNNHIISAYNNFPHHYYCYYYHQYYPDKFNYFFSISHIHFNNNLHYLHSTADLHYSYLLTIYLPITLYKFLFIKAIYQVIHIVFYFLLIIIHNIFIYLYL